jgi:glutathione S-transferase
MEYVQRVLALPGMQRWYAAALQESWRDDAHEQEAQQSGRVWQDLRAPAA